LKVLGVGWTKITDTGLPALAQLVELRELDLRQTAVTDLGLKSLTPFTKLEILELGRTKITDAGLKELRGFEKVRRLRVDHTGVTDAGLKDFALLPTLDSLDLEGNQVTDAGLKDLLPIVTLTGLNLTATKVTDAGLADLARFPRLEWLALERSPVTGSGFENTTGFKQLSTLWMSGTPLTDATLKHVATLARLNNLQIEKTAVTDAGVKELAPLRQLANLSLDNTKVTDACIPELAGFPRLWLLNLSGTKVGDAGLKQLAELARVTDQTRRLGSRAGSRLVDPIEPAPGGGAPAKAADPEINAAGKVLNPGGGVPVARGGFQSLRWLGLHNTQVTDAGVKHLAALPGLDTLWISWTKVSDAGLKDIAKLTNLHTLRLGGCKVTDEGLRDLAPLTNLRILWLDWTQITDFGLRELAVLKGIEELRLDGTPVTDAGMQELAALKQLQRVELQKTAVTDAGIAKLQSKLTNATIKVKAADEPATAPSDGRAFWWLLTAVGLLAAGALLVWLFVKRRQALVPTLACVSLAALAVIGYHLVSALLAEPPPSPAAQAKLRILKGHKGPIHDLRFTPDGKKLISASGWPAGPERDHSVRIWDLATDQELVRIPATGQIGAIELSADGRFLLVGAQGGVFYIDAEAGQVLKIIRGHGSPVSWVSFAADGKHVYSASLDGFARKLNLEDSKEVKRFKVHGKWARFAAELPDGRLITADNGGVMQFWDVATGEEVQRIDGKVGWLSSAALAPGGKELLLAGWNFSAWDLATAKKLRTFEGNQSDTPRMVFSPDGKKLLTACWDGSVKLWDYETANLLHEVSSQNEWVFTAVFAPDGRTIAHGGGGGKQGDQHVAGEDHDIRVLDVSDLMSVPAASAGDGMTLRTIGLLGAAAALALVAGFALWRWRRQAMANGAIQPSPLQDAGIVTFPCPQCGKSLKAKNELAGKKVKCPRCTSLTFVPSIQAPTPAASA
jgi:Leucine-rich repeat (LRR) protein/phage FluMu protein Com